MAVHVTNFVLLSDILLIIVAHTHGIEVSEELGLWALVTTLLEFVVWVLALERVSQGEFLRGTFHHAEEPAERDLAVAPHIRATWLCDVTRGDVEVSLIFRSVWIVRNENRSIWLTVAGAVYSIAVSVLTLFEK